MSPNRSFADGAGHRRYVARREAPTRAEVMERGQTTMNCMRARGPPGVHTYAVEPDGAERQRVHAVHHSPDGYEEFNWQLIARADREARTLEIDGLTSRHGSGSACETTPDRRATAVGSRCSHAHTRAGGGRAPLRRPVARGHADRVAGTTETPAPTRESEPALATSEGEPKRLRFPTAFAVLAAVLLLLGARTSTRVALEASRT